MNFANKIVGSASQLSEPDSGSELARKARQKQSSEQSSASGTAGRLSPEDLAEHNYQKGLGIIQQAELQGFQDPRVLYQAYRHLLVAVRKNASEPRYPCGVAYLLILLNQNERARGYLDLALSLDPEYARALKLKEVIQKLKENPEGALKKQRWKIFSELPVPRSDDDFDDLYEAVEEFIAQETHGFMHSELAQDLSLDSDQLQCQQVLLGELRQFLHLVHQKLSVLEQEIETQDLELSLTPVQQILKRLQKTLSQAEEMSSLQADIQRASREVIQLLNELYELQQSAKPNGETQTFDNHMECFYDICDALADQLDALSRHCPITLLEPAYNVLIQKVQALQELVDGV